MDQALSGPLDSLLDASTTRKETSRCARCVKDKKGCDRGAPCNRCIETGYGQSCVYTGTILPSRRRTSALHGPRRRKRSSMVPLDDSEHSPMSPDGSPSAVMNGHGSQSVRRRKRHRSSLLPSTLKQRNLARRQLVDEDWFSEPPSRAEEQVAFEEPEKTEEELARAKIYSSYTDIVTHLPVEIYRSTTFIRTLDLSYKQKSLELDRLCRELKASTDTSTAIDLRRKIVTLMKESKEDRAEALAEVSKLQTLVEGHIALLGNEVDKIENPNSDAPVMAEMETAVTPSRKSKKAAKSQESTNGQVDKMDIPIDEDEPIYCYCQRVSFGKMMACENEQCEGGEWFHFECLGYTTAPRGKWWCEVCIKAGFAGKNHARIAEEPTRATKVQGESKAERRSRIREENRVRELVRREKLRKRKGR